MDIWEAFKQYLNDAAPGGSMNREWTPENVRTAGETLSMMPNPAGDVASGLLAVDDLRKGNYGDAALNGVGLLPFVPSLAGAVKPTDRLLHGSLGGLSGDLRKGTGSLGDGFYLTNRDTQAALYPKLHAIKQGIKNPDVRVTEMETSARNILNLDEMGGIPVGGVDVEKLKNAGYEGVTVNNELLIFDPLKVKVKN